MHFEGNPEVFRRLHTKKQFLSEGSDQHADVRPLVIMLSGCNRGAYSSGQIRALERNGFSQVFDVAIGVSAGAPTCAYLLAEQSPLGASIFYEECTTPQFISLPRVDLDFMAAVFRGQTGKALNQEAVKASRTELFVSATCAETGEGHLLNAKTMEPDLVQALRISISMPGLGGPAVRAGERLYLDGVGGATFPVKEAIERFEPTDILVLANAPQDDADNHLKRFAYWCATREYPRAVRQAFTRVQQRFGEELHHLKTRFRGNYGILWTDKEVGSFEQNPERLKSAVDRADMHLNDLLVVNSPT